MIESQSYLNKYRIFWSGKDVATKKEDFGIDYPERIYGVGWVEEVKKIFDCALVGDYDSVVGRCIRNNFAMCCAALHIFSRRHVHIFRIEKNLIEPLVHSDSDNAYMPLPFQTIFIDGTIKISENIILEGLFIEDAPEKNAGYGNDNFIQIAGVIKTRLKNGQFIRYPLSCTMPLTQLIDDDSELNGLKLLKEDIHKSVANFVYYFINFVNIPDIEIIQKIYSKDEIIIRLKRGKFPRDSNNIVRVTGKTKVYIDQINSLFESQKIDFSHRFWVRGHFVHLRSDRYTRKKGTIIWKHPFIKGIGEVVTKDYIVGEKSAD